MTYAALFVLLLSEFCSSIKSAFTLLPSDQYCTNEINISNAHHSLEKGRNLSHPVLGFVVEYRCKSGFEFVDKNHDSLECILKDDKLVWDGTLPQCKASRCPDPGVVLGGRRKGKCCNVGSKVTFSCKKRYKITGVETIECLQNYTWSAQRPRCEPITCEDPGAPPNGKSEGNCCHVGDTLKFWCDEKYKIIGEKSIICRKDGNWSAPRPLCQHEFCYDPGRPQNDRTETCLLALENGTFSCSGYNDVLDQEIKECFRKNSNFWRYSFCERRVCVDLKAPPLHGRRTGKCCHTDDEMTFSCEKGYRILGKEKSKCLFYSFWSNLGPYCEEILCNDPGVSPNGVRRGTCCHIGDRVTYECEKGYELIGDSVLECLEEGNWTSPRPRCRPFDGKYCSDPPIIFNGSIVTSKEEDYYIFEDHATVKCDSGFAPKNGSIVITCEEDSRWDANFAQCEEISCELPPGVNIGTFQLKDEKSIVLPYGFELTYACKPGFRLVGDSSRVCGITGWSGKTPRCEAIRCYDPGSPENGRRGGLNFEIGSKVSFDCFSGYALIGSSERYCLPNGQWSGELARCDIESNYCPHPGTPINGWKSGDRYDKNEYVSFGCHPGFFLVGSTKRMCKPNHTWSGSEPKCRGVNDFDDRAVVAKELVALAEKNAHEQHMEIYINKPDPYCPGPGNCGPPPDWETRDKVRRIILYFLFDSSGSIGPQDFRTSIEFAKALVRKIGVTPEGIRVGAMTFSSSANIEFRPQHYASTSGVLAALDNIKQSHGGTATKTALEKLKNDMIPDTRFTFGWKILKYITFILTDGRPNMAGDPEYEAKALHDVGVQIFCIGITAKVNQDLLHRMASEPTEDHVFILNSYESLAWLIQELTNGTIDYSQCGLGLQREPGVGTGFPRIHSDDNFDARAITPWPWMAALFVDHQLLCGGSIIDHWWILTAAHCLMDGSKERNASEVIVKLGLTDRRNTRYLREFESEEFVIHGNFNPVSLDYDIALIKLLRPIYYDKYVRPICLPTKDLPTETTLYKPNEIGYATGWGENRRLAASANVRLRPVQHLKELKLPIPPRKVCEESIRDRNYIFTSRMFCAGSGLGDADTCKGDSGGPLMQSQMDQEGNIFWVQVGITSWGEGCGLVDKYGFNTNVHQLRDWIANATEQ